MVENTYLKATKHLGFSRAIEIAAMFHARAVGLFVLVEILPTKNTTHHGLRVAPYPNTLTIILDLTYRCPGSLVTGFDCRPGQACFRFIAV